MVESFVEGVVKNFIAGVGFFVKKTKEVEDDIRKKWCDYPSAQKNGGTKRGEET